MGRPKRNFRQGRGRKRQKIDIRNFGKEKKESNPQNSSQAQAGEDKPITEPLNAQEIESSESEEEEPTVSSYHQLLSAFGKTTDKTTYKYSDEEESEDAESDEEVEDNAEFGTDSDQLQDAVVKSDNEISDNAEEEGKEQKSSGELDESEDEDESEDDEVDVDEDDDGDELDDDGDESDAMEEEEEQDEENDKNSSKDVFFRRMDRDIGDKMAAKLAEGKVCSKTEVKWPCLGRMVCSSLIDQPTQLNMTKGQTLQELNVRKRIADQWQEANATFLKDKEQIFSPLQEELFSVMNSYQDMLYTERNYTNAEEIRHAYCLHILNHVIKTRNTVQKHNSMLSADSSLDSETMRDQGLTRPRVLIVVPFRDAALRIVNIFIKLLEAEGAPQHVSHRKRFEEEYSELEPYESKLVLPEDWEVTFAGNTDDHFRIGLAVSRKHLRLYTQFYLSDIIIASPLGLRTVVGSKGDNHQDYDFLSSIEMLVMDQADIFLMQNWEHITHLMEYIHLQPKESHDVDFSRVRMWTINGWSKFYRQTLLFSSIVTPEINALFTKQCFNFSGRVLVQNSPDTGSICQVVTQLPQVFHKIDCSSFVDAAQKRFDFFVSKIIPQFSETIMAGTMIYVPSYFDFVRIRNYFRKQDIRFAQICEYTSQPNIARARQYMFKGERHFLLYTERFHFFRRYKTRAIRHILFYQLPSYPHFYSEICNTLESTPGAATEHNCTVLYSRYDAQRLAAVVGTERCTHMLSTKKNVHMFVSGEER